MLSLPPGAAPQALAPQPQLPMLPTGPPNLGPGSPSRSPGPAPTTPPGTPGPLGAPGGGPPPPTMGPPGGFPGLPPPPPGAGLGLGGPMPPLAPGVGGLNRPTLPTPPRGKVSLQPLAGTAATVGPSAETNDLRQAATHLVGPAVGVSGAANGGDDSVGGWGATNPHEDYERALADTQAVTFGAAMLLILRFASSLLAAVTLASPKLEVLAVICYGLTAIAVLFGIVTVVKPMVVPKGCEFIPRCATAEYGIYSCPCMPWTHLVWGVIAFVSSGLVLATGDFSVLIVEVLSSALSVVFGAIWLRRLSIQEGILCCVPWPETAAAPTPTPARQARGKVAAVHVAPEAAQIPPKPLQVGEETSPAAGKLNPPPDPVRPAPQPAAGAPPSPTPAMPPPAPAPAPGPAPSQAPAATFPPPQQPPPQQPPPQQQPPQPQPGLPGPPVPPAAPAPKAPPPPPGGPPMGPGPPLAGGG